MMTTNNENQRNRNMGLYVHLPFCQRKCSYCGFLSLADQPETLMRQYLNDLLIEADLHLGTSDAAHGPKHVVDTIFIGGGTPSLYDGPDIQRLMDGLRSRWQISSQAEITMESNPNSLGAGKLAAYRAAGINRLSIGVQSFDDRMLVQIGRLHDSQTAKQAFFMAREAGFDNIGLDLMFGLPGQTLSQWKATLKTAVSLSPEHLSLYTLQIEEGTPLYKDYKAEKLPKVDTSVDRDCYHFAIGFLKKNGYYHYEISNFAKAGRACRHNLKYWSMGDFLGLGLNASSHMDGRRWTNLSDLDEWRDRIGRCQLPVDQDTVLRDTDADAMGIFLFTGLRKTEGIGFEAFKTRFGVDFFHAFADNMDQLNEYRRLGLMGWSEPPDGRLWLTETGIDRSNEIMSEFV